MAVSPLRILLAPALREKSAELIGLSAVSGLANTVILALLGGAGTGQHGFGRLAVLLSAVLAYVVCQSILARLVSRNVERRMGELRLDLLQALRNLPFASLETIGKARLMSVLVGDVHMISSATAPISAAIQSGVQLLLATIYLFLLSKLAFCLAMSVSLCSGYAYLRRLRLMAVALQAADLQNRGTLERIEDALRGAFQIKQFSAASAAIRAAIEASSQRASALHETAQRSVGSVLLFGQFMFFLLLGVMIWELPEFGLSDHTIIRTVTVLLYVLGAIGGLLQGIVTFTNADGAAIRIMALRQDIALPETPVLVPASTVGSMRIFRSLQVADLRYAYPARSGNAAFSVGPLDLTLRRGEIIFIRGGNGAGKSTLLKLITGLYEPDAGRLLLNDFAVHSTTLQTAELTSVVFSDVYLFSRLWGVGADQQGRARALLTELGLADKVDVQDNRFTTTALSTGQRKRLALVAAVLEDRPVLILDEFASDQDPEFRAHFYRHLLPRMRAAGLTVVAVMHDDAYFGCADRLYVMEEGRLVEDNRSS